MIDAQTQDRIRAATDIVEVLSDFLSLRRAGTNYKCLCPFHQEKTPSFMVSPTKGIFKCFSCGEGGDAISFLMKHEQMTYPEALRWLAKKYGIEVHEKEETAEERARLTTRESLFIVNQWAQEQFEQTLHDSPEGQSIGMAYLRRRGFRDDIIRKFRLGYALQDRSALRTAAQKAGHSLEKLIEVGLCYKTERGTVRDRFAGRVIFPVQALDGKVVAFGGRVLSTENKQVAKYVNSPESEIYSKRYHLYGLFQAKRAIQKADCCYLVEGYTDVISMHQSGVENVVASSGTSLTTEQIRLIKRFTLNLTILYDGDAAGIKASLRGINMLLEEGMNIRCLLLPDGEDPDSFARNHGGDEAVAYVSEHQVNFIRFKSDLLLKESEDDPYKRGQAVTDILESIALIPDAVVRYNCVRELSTIASIDERVLLQRTRDLRRKHYEEKKQTQQSQDSTRSTATVEENKTTESVQPATLTLQPNTAQSEPGVSKAVMQRETALMQIVLRQGLRPMHTEGAEGQSVLQFIIDELNQDGIDFVTPVYARIFELLRQRPDKDPRALCLSSEDTEIKAAAAALLTDKYTLSTHSTAELAGGRGRVNPQAKDMEVFRALVDLKWVIVDDELHLRQDLLKDAKPESEQRDQLMGEIVQLRRAKAQLQGLISQYSH